MEIGIGITAAFLVWLGVIVYQLRQNRKRCPAEWRDFEDTFYR